MPHSSSQRDPPCPSRHIGDAKTLLAMNLSKKKAISRLAGFTLPHTANGGGPFHLQNTLRFEPPEKHAQDGSQPANGSNLLAIHDAGVATAFAIEAIGRVDHFDFLDRLPAPATTKKEAPTSEQHAAAPAGWFLSTTDKWTAPYYDSNGLHCADRLLFA